MSSKYPLRYAVAVVLLLVGRSAARAASDSDRPPLEAEHPARVVSVYAGRVIIASDWPITVGDRFAIWPASPQTALVARHGVFTVDRVDGRTASGRLPRGVVARAGDTALPTLARPRERLIAPAPWRGITRARATLRPTASTTDGGGFVLLGDLAVDYQFRAPVRLGVAAMPLGVVANGHGREGSAQLLGTLAYSGDRFEIGVGLGADLHSVAPPAGAAVALMSRAGSIDGVHATATLSLVAERRGTRFGGGTASIDVPVGRRLNLHATGGGSASWFYAHLGFRIWARGAGGPGTLIFTAAAGASGISEVGGFNFGVRGVGPSLTFGIEVRE